MQVDRKQQVIIIVLAAVLLFTAGYRISRWYGEQNRSPGKGAEMVQPGGAESVREVVVHVAGAVERPGVYKFSREMRVADALERAVPLAQADVQGLNLAAPLKDGQKIVVPVKQESFQAAGPASQPGAAPQPVLAPQQQKVPAVKTTPRININRADRVELETLPGVGPGLAQRIINHRESKGLFMSEDEIKNVPGIGEKLYDQIRDFITVN